MSNDISTSLHCMNCNAKFVGPIDDMVALDFPCPQCGSVTKIMHIELTDFYNFEVHESLRIKEKDISLPSRKNPRVDHFSGDDLRKSDGKWMCKERLIDKNNNLYKEIVIDPTTGEVVHSCDEFLSSHINHGAARTKY